MSHAQVRMQMDFFGTGSMGHRYLDPQRQTKRMCRHFICVCVHIYIYISTDSPKNRQHEDLNQVRWVVGGSARRLCQLQPTLWQPQYSCVGACAGLRVELACWLGFCFLELSIFASRQTFEEDPCFLVYAMVGLWDWELRLCLAPIYTRSCKI